MAAPAHAVVGGKPVPDGQFRYVANVRIMGGFGCSGTLIAPQWVLTAGHCGSATGSLTQGLVPSSYAWPSSAYQVVLGTVNADGKGGETHDVSEVQVDSDYAFQNGTGNDVTLMKLDKPSKVVPMKIAALGERSSWAAGAMTTIAGFGTTKDDPTADPPDRMMYAQVPITTDDYCAKAYPDGLSTVADDGSFDAKTMVCAGYPQGGTDTCEGDSGGPLLSTVGKEYRLAAATSFGAGCGQPGKPGVYARLADGPIRNWIKGVVPTAFAPEPKPATTKTKKRVSRRCSRRRAHGRARHRHARARSCRRAARR